MIPVILKGDTSGNITINLATGYDYASCILRVSFNGIVREFDQLVAGGTKLIQYTADETDGMRLGTSPVFLELRNAAGVVRTMPWAKIKVTDAPSAVYDCGITVDPSQLDIDDPTGADSLGDVKRKLKQVMDFLRGGVSLAVAFCCFCSFGDLCPTNTLNDVPGTITISNLVVASGVATGGGGGGITANDATNAAAAVVVRDVPSWARQANQPESMTTNALVLTNGAVKTKDGSSTITAAQVGAPQIDEWGRVFIGRMGTIAWGTPDEIYATMYIDGNKKLYFSGFGINDYLALLNDIPSVPQWALANNKPNYTAAEVGAVASGSNINIPLGSMYSINGAAGANAFNISIVGPTGVPCFTYRTAAGVQRTVQLPADSFGIAITDQSLNNYLGDYVQMSQLTNTALRVASRTWDTGYQILWEKQAVNGGFYEVCVTNVNLTTGGVQ